MQLERLFTRSDPLRRAPVVLRYLVALAVVLFFFGLRSMFGPILGGYPFLLFFPAIIVVSVLLDRGTGVFAVIVSTLLAWYFYVPPERSFALPTLRAAIPLVLYVTVALFLAGTVEALRSTAQRLARTAEKLEHTSEINRLLLVDVNHRVKNHLASVSGLLRLSMRGINDEGARGAIEAAIARISVLGQVYERLHLGERATVVSSREFIEALCEGLRQGVLGARPIAMRVRVDDLPLGSMQAVPIGLIINELVENALKYAFPESRAGDIDVSLKADAETLMLVVKDDGVGFDKDATAPGGGTRIVRSLVQQLGGRIVQDGKVGTEVTITLPRRAPDEAI